MSIILREMHERGSSYWAWPEEVWHEILQPTFKAFHQRYPHFSDQTVRFQLLVMGYFFCPLRDLSRSLLRSV
jgi:hypothetical protein